MKRIFSILFVLVLAVSLMLVPAAPVGASPGPGIVGLWHFDGDANDSSGYNNHGTVYGATYVSGKFGQALSFDGANDYVDCAAAVDDSITTGVTLEAWIKPTAKQNGGIISNDYTLGNKKGYDFFLWAAHDTYGRLYIDFGNGTDCGRTWWAIPSLDWYGHWHHVAATWDGSTVKLYVDGSEVGGTASLSGNYSGPTKDTLIGGINYGVTLPYCPFNGLIDEVRIWNVAVNPVTVSLRAGQHMDAGTVTVWNDSTDLHVEYQTSGGWCLSETHLHVATSLDGIPQKNGNPPPGQFDYKAEHDCVTAYTYTIPLLSSTPLYIAAHAEVQKLGDVMTASLVSGADTDSVLVIEEDANNSGYPLGYPGPYSDTPTSSVVIQGTEAAYSGWPPIPDTDAQWISDSTANPGIVNSWRLFTRNFSIPSNATNISGTLRIDSDNAEKAKINGSPADGLVYGEVYGAFIDDGEWERVQHWPVGSYLQPGPNTLEVMVRNYYWEPTPGMWNYAGLIYKMDYEYQLLTTETAWGAGSDFPGKNWATYFMYHVQ